MIDTLLLMHAQTPAEAIAETIVLGVVFTIMVIGVMFFLYKILEL